MTLSNTGTAPLDWEAKERDHGATAPELPPAPTAIRQARRVGPQRPPAGFPKTVIQRHDARTGATSTLSTIITDPAGDSLDSNDVTTVRAGSDGSTIASMAIDFAPTTPMDQVGGYVYLDTDQDPSTGVPAEAFFGMPTQDVGIEYFVDLFELANSDGVVLVSTPRRSRSSPSRRRRRSTDQTISFDIPLEALGGDDGFINTAMVVGLHRARPTGRPDDGHGTIEPFSDAPWLSETPESGDDRAGGSPGRHDHTWATRRCAPGEYHALVVFVTNAPKQTQVPVDVTLTVTLPPEFGAIDRHGHRRPHRRAARRRGRGRSTRRGKGAPLDADGDDRRRRHVLDRRSGRHVADGLLARRLRAADAEHHDRQGRHDAPAPTPRSTRTSRTPSSTAARSRSSSRRAAPRA